MIYYNFLLILLALTKSAFTQSCTSSYAPFYKGNCVSPSICQGALLNNLCPGSLKCCITDSTYKTQSFVSKSQLENILSLSNARTEYISKILISPTANPSCFQKAAFLSQLIHETGKFMNDEELGDPSIFTKYDGRNDLGNTQIGDGNFEIKTN